MQLTHCFLTCHNHGVQIVDDELAEALLGWLAAQHLARYIRQQFGKTIDYIDRLLAQLATLY